MLKTDWRESKITTDHLAKLTYVYVRQSSLNQVMHNRESTELQYQLVDRAVGLGWPRERIKVIDEDLGKSAASADERLGFQTLLAEISLGRVGLVLGFDASRLARNNSDWYRMLELCSVFGVLFSDSDRVYDPGMYSDRMLLGLSGLMSEAELHQIRRRLRSGAWNKAQRGELRIPLPAGLCRDLNKEVVLNPDEEVQSRIRLVFEKFQELKTAKAVVRYLRQENLRLPSRDLKGPAPHEVTWKPTRGSIVRSILKNPAYAGTYVYGRKTMDPTRKKPGRPRSGLVLHPIDEWPIVLHNVYPAYISWETFLANQAQFKANQCHYREDKVGAPKKGQALLQGILRCGRCGLRMTLHYSGPHKDSPYYRCHIAASEYGKPDCQSVRARGLDREVERLVLEALEPDNLEIALAALEALEEEYANLKRQRKLHLERLKYETDRAQRQYEAVEPENRLVARNLESRWEEKLRAVEAAEQEYHSWAAQQQLEVGPSEREMILALGEDLPKVWYASTTTPADRKQILRLLIKEVIVDRNRIPGKVWFQVNWQTGAISQHEIDCNVVSYRDHPQFDLIQERIRELHAACKFDAEIAEALNAEGFRTTKQGPFSNQMVCHLRQRIGLPSIKKYGMLSFERQDGWYSVRETAEILELSPITVKKWLRKGRLEGKKLRKDAPWRVFLPDEQVDEIKKTVRKVRSYRSQAL
jgi:DNA invertase Pin-like site-specific DNA recombinase